MARRPLDGVRVLAIEQALAMPVATLGLAALGADVIRVESAQRSDANPHTRARSGSFSALNRNKRGITLDFRAEEGRALVRRLVAISDVVVENFARRVLAGFGLDYAALVRVKPDLIMLSITGYGHDGPYADYRSFGPNSEAMGGLVWHTRHPAGYYLFPGGMAFGDTVAGHYGALAVLAALVRRRRTGRGAYIDLTQYEALVSFVGEDLVAAQRGEPLFEDRANEHPWMAPHGVYACAGDCRWIALAVESDAQWSALRGVIGDPAWAADPAYATRVGRMECRAEIDARLEEWTRTRDRDELAAALRAAGVPALPVQDGRDVTLDPLFWRCGALEMVDLTPVAPEVGVAPHNAAPWRFARTRVPLQEPPPAALGRDNDAVFSGLLGLGADEVRRLEEIGVAVRTAPAGEPRPEPSPAEQKRTGAVVDYDADFRERIAAVVAGVRKGG
jgi:crotonobetainyl-CoA:carnitine CoA-transferase CaiB-like acyl-CoA transferase